MPRLLRIAALFIATTMHAQSLKVDTIAGQPGMAGMVDGPGSDARLDRPGSIAADDLGDVYIVSPYYYCIRKMTPEGVVTTFAGICSQSDYVNGDLGNARFERLGSIAVDHSGSIFVTDSYTIRKIDSAGTVSTFAGIPGSQGAEDGPPRLGRFMGPGDLTLDAAGNLYLSDIHLRSLAVYDPLCTNYTIRKVAPGGYVSTIAGQPCTWGYQDGPASRAMFNDIQGLVADPAGNLYVSHEGGIRTVTTDGTVVTIAGDKAVIPASYIDSGMAHQVRLSARGITIDSHRNLFVIDQTWWHGSLIRRLNIDGLLATVAGSPVSRVTRDGTGAFASFHSPPAITVTPSDVLYLSDSYDQIIRRAFVTTDGDTNGDGVIDVADLFYLINHLFAAGPSPIGLGDVNGNGRIEVADVFYLINYLFRGGPPLAKAPPPSYVQLKVGDSVIRDLQYSGLADVIVQFTDPVAADVPDWERKAAIAAAAQTILSRLASQDYIGAHAFIYTPGISMRINQNALNALVSMPDIEYIGSDFSGGVS